MQWNPWREILHLGQRGTQKKPLEISPPGASVPHLTTSPLSSRCPVRGSGRTVGKSRGHRPCFGRSQAKKAAGNAAHQQGDECVEGAGLPATPPSSISHQGRGHRLRTAKKMGVFPKHPRVRRIAPSPKKHSNDDVRSSNWSSPSRQNEGCGQQAKKKTGFPRSSPRHHSRPRRYGSTQRPTDGEPIPAACLGTPLRKHRRVCQWFHRRKQ